MGISGGTFKDAVMARVGGRNMDYCLQCGTCNTICPVRNVDKNFNPRDIVRSILLGREDYLKQHPEVLYACLLCDLCEKVCPLGLKVGVLIRVVREQFVEEGLGPLKAHQYVKDEETWALSDSFALFQNDTDATSCSRVFFPGCNLAAYSPEIVLKTYEYLRRKLPGTGIILQCCGAPSHGLGDHSRFREILARLKYGMSRLGAFELIVACPDCYRTLKSSADSFKVTTVYEILVEIGIPQTVQPARHTFALHDSCTVRWDKEFQDSVRKLIKLSGQDVDELLYSRELTKCCGMGGLTFPLNLSRVFEITRQRIQETNQEMLTYCAACRETFAVHRPSLHVLDLSFNPNWNEAMSKRPNKPKMRKDNQRLLRNTLIGESAVNF